MGFNGIDIVTTFTVGELQAIRNRMISTRVVEHSTWLDQMVSRLDGILADVSVKCEECNTHYGLHHFPDDTTYGGTLCHECEIKALESRKEELEADSMDADKIDRLRRQEEV